MLSRRPAGIRTPKLVTRPARTQFEAERATSDCMTGEVRMVAVSARLPISR